MNRKRHIKQIRKNLKAVMAIRLELSREIARKKRYVEHYEAVSAELEAKLEELVGRRDDNDNKANTR